MQCINISINLTAPVVYIFIILFKIISLILFNSSADNSTAFGKADCIRKATIELDAGLTALDGIDVAFTLKGFPFFFYWSLLRAIVLASTLT